MPSQVDCRAASRVPYQVLLQLALVRRRRVISRAGRQMGTVLEAASSECLLCSPPPSRLPQAGASPSHHTLLAGIFSSPFSPTNSTNDGETTDKLYMIC